MSKRIAYWIFVAFIFIFLIAASIIFYYQYLLTHNQSKGVSLGVQTQKAGDPKVYPDPYYTPGDIFTGITEREVCTPGYTKTVRNVPLAVKKIVYQEYGYTYPQSPGEFEVDHFVPLELGGSNDLKNLFLEPAEPRPGFHEKDVVENYLHTKVCNGEIPLKQAQQEIIFDWYAVYKQIPSHNSFN